jgi:hypothetical protein
MKTEQTKIAELKKSLAKKGQVNPGDLMIASRAMSKPLPAQKPLSKTIPSAKTRVGVAVRGIF